MEAIGEITDTAFVIQKSAYNQSYFSIEPILQDGSRGLRTTAIDYNILGGCFIRTFTERVGEEGVFLQLQLGTSYGVGRILFEREDAAENYHTIMTVTIQDSQTSFEVLDDDPIQGLNRYRATIFGNDGRILTTTFLEVYFITKYPYTVFPNPVAIGQELKIFSDKPENQAAVFELLGTSGAVLFSHDLTSDREILTPEGLDVGLYFYRIRSMRGVFIGKLLIRNH